MSAFAIACWTWMRLAFVWSPELFPSALMFCCWRRAHEEISSLHLKRPIVSRSALSSTGRNSVSRNAPNPSSPSQGCSRVPPVGMEIRAVAEARVELLHQLVVAGAGERGGEADLRLEPDVDAVLGRHPHVVDADAVAAARRARDDVAPRRALRRIQPRVLAQPAGPREAGRRRDQLALRLLVERAAVVDDADLVRPGPSEARERDQHDDHQQQRDRRSRRPRTRPHARPAACPARRAGGSASPARPRGP